jgi:hypothetical protein
MSVWFIISATHRLVWMSYNTQDCVTCHKVPSIKLGDSLIIVGGFHWDGSSRRPFIIAFDTSFSTKFYRAWNWNPIPNATNFAIVDMVKISDTDFVAVGGASNSLDNNSYGYIVRYKYDGSIIWSKYISNINLLTGLDFDGSYIIATGMQGDRNGNGSRLIKLDLDGNLIYHKSYSNRSAMDIVYDRFSNSYVILQRQRNLLIKTDINGNVIWSYQYPANVREQPQALIVDNDGNYVFVGHLGPDAGPANIELFKINSSNGSIIYQRFYTSNIGNSDERAYNITLDYDGNYLIAGFVRESNTSSMPFAMKINKDNGSIIWVRAWILAPAGFSSNKGMGILSVNPEVYLLSGYIGSGADASSGMFFLFFRDTVANCIRDITNRFLVGNLNLTRTSVSVSPSNIISTISDLTLNPYAPVVNENDVGGSCSTPVSENEYISSCQRGYIEIDLIKKRRVLIWDVAGNLVYKNDFEGRKRIKLRAGIYIVKIDNKKFKIIVQ